MSAAKNDAWMAFYTADYLKDTTRLTTLAHGAYILLLIEYWNTGPLLDNDEDLAAITRMPLKDWLKMRPTLARLPFFNVADGIWRQKRADEEIAKREGISQERSGAGKAGAEKRWGKQRAKQTDGNSIANAIGQPLANAQQNDAQSQSQEESKKTGAPPDQDKQSRLQIIKALDDAIAEHHGEHLRRPNAAPNDWEYAGRMLETGAPLELICATIEHLVGTWAGEGQPPPKKLSTFEIWVGNAWRDRCKAQSKPVKRITPDAEKASVDQDLERWKARIKHYRSGGKWEPSWGPDPQDPNCRAPASLLLEPIARVA
jgi:uncharacterized protein YdaU (DUF1376 family)